tara:strand:- start:372 stop:518 length:147 start_codon:yes stop_codon:yes gene_type:complete
METVIIPQIYNVSRNIAERDFGNFENTSIILALSVHAKIINIYTIIQI